MKKTLVSIITTVVCCVAFSTLATAQDDRTISAAGQTYVISAKAGAVNAVEGNVTIVRADGKSGVLLKSDSLGIGESVMTGANGKAELLLNPGSFVRLGGNSKFGFLSTDLDNLKLKLNSGSAILEIYASDELKVQLELPSTTIEFTNSGVYRVNVLSNGTAQVAVWKGRFLIGENKAEVKEGRTVVVGTKTPLIAKFDRDNKDELDIWSQMRGKEAAKIEARLKRDALRNSLMGAYGAGSWNMFSTLGVWVFDFMSGRWYFLPFGRGWRTPYGYGYGFNIFDCRLPQYVYTDPPVILPPVVTPTGPTAAQIREERRQNMHTPTFQRFENSQRNNGRGDNAGSNNNNTDNGSGTGIWTPDRSNNDQRDSKPSSQPTYTPPTQSAPIIVMPSRQETKDVKDN